jgi:hypothetical protein
LLLKLLHAIEQQQTRGAFRISVVVCDNDREQSSRQSVEKFAADSKLEIRYVVEPEQNIALARNRVVANAAGDYVAFIDDDEHPVTDWLYLLWQTRERYGADGALGPVKPQYESEPPQWVLKGGFYDRPAHQTGHRLLWQQCRTGNVLLRRDVLADVAGPFRSELGGGGEDRDFFCRISSKGRTFVWCEEAVAWETVPAARCSRSFMLRRALLRGKMSLRHHKAGVRDVATSVIAVPVYSLALPFLLVAGHHHFMNGLIRLCDHAGRLLSTFGIDPIRQAYVTE